MKRTTAVSGGSDRGPRACAAIAALVVLLASALATNGAAAQNPVLQPDTMPVADTIPYEPPSPRGAFIRAMLVPGWGHVYIDEYTRGAVYFSLQSASWFMLIRTLRRLGDAEDRFGSLRSLAVDSLEMEIAADTALERMLRENPAAYEAALLTYPGLDDTRKLVRARKQQRQDWVTYTLFFTFAAAVDAYVSAHLKDFPADVTAVPAPGGGLNIGVHVPIGGRR